MIAPRRLGGGGFGIFDRSIGKGAVVRAIPAPGAGERPRSFFDKLNDWARDEGWPGLGYIVFDETGGKGPIANNLEADRVEQIRSLMDCQSGRRCVFSPAINLPGPRRLPASPGHGWQMNSIFQAKNHLPVLLDRRLSDVRMGRGRAEN